MSAFIGERDALNERLLSATSERGRAESELSALRCARLSDTSDVVVAMTVDNAVLSLRCDESAAEIARLRLRIDELNAAEWTATEITHITAAHTPPSQRPSGYEVDKGAAAMTVDAKQIRNVRRNEYEFDRDGRSDDYTSDNDNDNDDGDRTTTVTTVTVTVTVTMTVRAKW